MGALMERYNKVIKPLHGPLSKYRPSCVPSDRSKTVSLECVMVWCEGFVEALVLDPGWQTVETVYGKHSPDYLRRAVTALNLRPKNIPALQF